MLDPTKHNYYPKLMKLYLSGAVPPGRFAEVDICHDDWCQVYSDGYCNCDPDVVPRPQPAPNPPRPSRN